MSTISSSTPPLRTTVNAASSASAGAAAAGSVPAPSVQAASGVRAEVQISSLASRLNKAEHAGSGPDAALSHDQLGDKVQRNIEAINYPLTEENKARMAREVPAPADASALASAAAANAYVNDLGGPNPFAGLSREQLSTISNDDSETFTTNERYAAYRQAYDEEQQWRTQAVAGAMAEYHASGKLTGFFESVLAHFNTLPRAEQALYPADYATDLQKKIDLDFNYFTNMPGDRAGKAADSTAGAPAPSGIDVAGLVRWPTPA